MHWVWFKGRHKRKLFVVVKFCQSFLLIVELYTKLVMFCFVISSLYVIEFVSPSSKLCFILAFQAPSLVTTFQPWRLLHELHIVVQASSFDDHCCNSSIKLRCCIWISINNVFQVLTTHVHDFLFYIFLLWCCFCFHGIVYKLFFSSTFCAQQLWIL